MCTFVMLGLWFTYLASVCWLVRLHSHCKQSALGSYQHFQVDQSCLVLMGFCTKQSGRSEESSLLKVDQTALVPQRNTLLHATAQQP